MGSPEHLAGMAILNGRGGAGAPARLFCRVRHMHGSLKDEAAVKRGRWGQTASGRGFGPHEQPAIFQCGPSNRRGLSFRISQSSVSNIK